MRKALHLPNPRVYEPAYIRRSRRLHLQMRPVTAIMLLLTFLAMLGWCTLVTSYAFFHDDVLTELIVRHNRSEHAYKDQISQLRDDLEQSESRRLMERTTFGDKLEGLHKRQVTLEQRQVALASLAGMGDGAAAQPASAAAPAARAKPMPVSDLTDIPTGSIPASSSPPESAPAAATLPASLSSLEHGFTRLETVQTAALDKIGQRLTQAQDALSGVYNQLGLSNPPASSQVPVGGPYIPWQTTGSDNFDKQLQRVVSTQAQVSSLVDDLRTVPLRNPKPGAEQTSGFGMRSDPFLKGMAFHAGVDFRADTGSPIYPTAGGTVISAGWSGGYGFMVEVQHKHGFSTRYGHLSAINVKENDVVTPDTVIGWAGTTGRSTGPHLHYETRLNGEALNPERFLNIGARIQGLL